MRIIIELKGGLIQRVSTDEACDIIIRDLDTEGADSSEICPPMSEDYAPSCVRREVFDSDYLPYDDSDYAKEFDALWDHLDTWLRGER